MQVSELQFNHPPGRPGAAAVANRDDAIEMEAGDTLRP